MNEKLTAKVQLMIEPSLIAQIDSWRYENRIASRSRAMRHLMSIGLVSCNEKGSAEAATSPSHSSTNPL